MAHETAVLHTWASWEREGGSTSYGCRLGTVRTGGRPWPPEEADPLQGRGPTRGWS